MREEIEAAALFITRLVNKNLSNACSTSSSIHSHSSSASSSLSSSSSTSSSASSSSSTSSDGAPDFDEHQHPTTSTTNAGDRDKVEQFKQCLEEALFERFHNHWFPEQPTKGQAYRCIRLNEWDRRDITLQKVCTQCGIDYKDLQLPVELTLWVDPDEVTCRFGENKGSHCLVAKFKEGELKDNNISLDINNIDIEFFRQTATDGTIRQQANSVHGSPDYNKQHNRLNNNSGGNANHTSYQFHNQHNNNNNNNNNNHPQQHQQHHQSQQLIHQHQQQQNSPHHHQYQSPHRANIGKAAIFPSSYHHGYSNACDTNGNPIPYYYF